MELGDLKPLSFGKFRFRGSSGIQGHESHLRRGRSIELLGQGGPGGPARAFSEPHTGKSSSYFPLTLKLIKIESCKKVANLIFFGKECFVFSRITFPGR